MTWNTIIKFEMEKDYFKKIDAFLKEDNKKHTIYPPKKDIFNAFKLCPPNKVKCLILGQDPYMHLGQAHGLCFSVEKNISVPPSLRNILKELKNDLAIDAPTHGCLTQWAENGVLLLNSILTVREAAAGSHKDIGWQEFTNTIISQVNMFDRPIVYILWGAFAKSKASLITNPKHLILTGAHPSPLSANQGGFFGGKYFSKTNEFLKENGSEPINWQLI